MASDTSSASCSRRHLLLALAATAAPPARAAAEPGPQPQRWPARRPTPALELPAWAGPPWSLVSARGQVVVLNFWASWCEPCRAEMPSLELLATRFEAQRLQVLALNFRETDGAIRRFVEQTALSLPILRDRDGGAAKAFGVRIFPSTVVFGRDGRAAFSVVGEVDWMSARAHRWLAPVLSR